MIPYSDFAVHRELLGIFEDLLSMCLRMLESTKLVDADKLGIKHCIKIIHCGLGIDEIRPNLVPALLEIIETHILPFLLLTEDDFDNFENNPVEFVNKLRTDSEEIETLQTSIYELILKVWSISSTDFTIQRAHSTKSQSEDPTYFSQLMNFWFSKLDQILKSTSEEDIKIKDVILSLLCSMSPLINSGLYDSKLINTLLTELWLYSCSDEFPESNLTIVPKILFFCENIYMCGLDSNTLSTVWNCHLYWMEKSVEAIKIQAWISLSKFVTDPEIMEEYEKNLEGIISIYIQMMEHNHDEIICSFQDVLERFSYWIHTHVFNIVTQITDRLSISKKDVAYGWLVILNIVLEAIGHDHKLVQKIDARLLSIFSTILTYQSSDWIGILTDWLQKIYDSTNEMTTSIEICFPQLLETVHHIHYLDRFGDGYYEFLKMGDFIWTMIETNHNEIFEENSDGCSMLDSVLNAMFAVLEISKRDFNVPEAMAAFKVMRYLLSYCPGQLDSTLPSFLLSLTTAMQSEDIGHFTRLELDQVFQSCLEYNSELTFTTAQQLSCSAHINSFITHSKVQEIEEIDAGKSLF